MSNYITHATLNILNGTLAGVLEFLPGLNLIGGENGTLKTKVLQQLRTGVAVPRNSNTALRIQSINPKRNSERRAAEQIWQQFRQQNKTLDTVLGERLNAQINDAGFDNYPSLGDLYYLVFDHRTKDGGNRRAHMEAVTAEFNTVIQSIFEHYRLVSEWNAATGAPTIKVRKGDHTEFPIEGLSLGEQEILGLVASLYAGRERVDVYLIDEPEVHLNWHLEEKLFAFLDDLCEAEEKQAIVATHSRAMFTTRYLPKALFLSWENNKITWGRQLTHDQQRRIAGEAIEIIKLGRFTRPTFFVEDSAHARFLEALSRCLGQSVTVTQCGNSSNVRSLYILSTREGGWQNTFFMTDGDNEGHPFPGAATFVHLPVYCIDNFLLHPDHLSRLFGRTILAVQSLILQAINDRREEVLKRNKFLDFLIDQIRPEHLTYERLGKLDGSAIIDAVADALGTTASDLTDRFLQHLHATNLLDQYLPPALLAPFHRPLPLAAPDQPAV